MSCHYSFDDRSMKRPRPLRKGTTLGDRSPPQSRRWRSACRSPDRHPARYSRACATAASVRREVARRRRRSVRAVIVDEYDFPSASATRETTSNVSASLKVGTTNGELGTDPASLASSACPISAVTVPSHATTKSASRSEHCMAAGATGRQTCVERTRAGLSQSSVTDEALHWALSWRLPQQNTCDHRRRPRRCAQQHAPCLS
jgi:hypothetical protein